MDLTKLRFGLIALSLTLALPQAVQAAGNFKYGNFDSWVVRHVHESGVIGGNTKTLYEIGPSQEFNGNKPYVNLGGSPWGTSNVMAKVMGVVKTNTSVYRDVHGSGHCAKMETHIETCKVLGMMNIKVLAAGSIFLGSMKEPITSTKEGPSALHLGVPFTLRPKALRFDYRVRVPGSKNRIRQNGFSKATTVAGPDYCIAVLYLQISFGGLFLLLGYNLFSAFLRAVGDGRSARQRVCPQLSRQDRACARDRLGRSRRHAHPHRAAILVEPRRCLCGYSGQHILGR